MVVGTTHASTTKEETLAMLGETEILTSVFPGITTIPCLINSPLRQDDNPSFSIYISSKGKVRFIDYATGDTGGLLDLLCNYWNCSFTQALNRVKNMTTSHSATTKAATHKVTVYKKTNARIEVKVRPWRDYDVLYWQSYGCNIRLLQKAEVYPISHKMVYKDGHKYTFAAPQYSYVFIERKEDKITKKIYSPFAHKYKWVTDNDSSVIGLWGKIPKQGDVICICSSLKDAVCLWSNSGIPCIYIQGEAFRISETAIKELKKRFHKVLICLDNDAAGIKDAEKLSLQTGFTNIVLPSFEGGKDISDAYKTMGKEKFIQTIVPLFTTTQNT